MRFKDILTGRRLVGGIATAVLVFAGVGCGEGEQIGLDSPETSSDDSVRRAPSPRASSDSNRSTSNGSNESEEKPAAAPASVGDSSKTGPSLRARDDVSYDPAFEGECQVADQLGRLRPGRTMTRSVDTESLAHHFNVRCLGKGRASSEYVARFRVEQPMMLHFDVESHGRDAKVELRRGRDCGHPDVIQTCTDYEEGSAFVQPGSTYFAVVQTNGALEGRLDVEFRPEAVRSSCSGGRVCQEGSVSHCAPMQGRLDRFACAAGCATDSACAGETCDQPLDVESDRTLTGFSGAYRSNYRTQFVPDDEGSEGAWQSVETIGEDLVLRLPDIDEGESVTIDASEDRKDHVVTIRSSCSSPSATLAATDLGERLEWRAPEAGTYWVIVDRTTTYPGPFEIDIDR
jgi:hypothetical protein